MQFQDIFIDLDNTILDFYATEAEVLGKALAAGGIAPEEDTLALYHHINLRQWQLLEEGAVSVDEIGVRRFALLVDALGVDVDAVTLAQTYEAMLADACYFMPGAEALLAALAPRYRLHLVTNGMASVQYDRIRRAGIDRYFDHLFVSSDIGAVKPHAAFFDAIRGGIQAGLHTIWYNQRREENTTPWQPDAEVYHLADVPEVLAKWEMA